MTRRIEVEDDVRWVVGDERRYVPVERPASWGATLRFEGWLKSRRDRRLPLGSFNLSDVQAPLIDTQERERGPAGIQTIFNFRQGRPMSFELLFSWAWRFPPLEDINPPPASSADTHVKAPNKTGSLFSEMRQGRGKTTTNTPVY
jgi:hypothetical protein